jgi:subtilisin family serine protease
LVLAFWASHVLATPTSQPNDINTSPSQDHRVLRRNSPNFEIVERPSGHHMQQITAGKKIDNDGKDHIVHMLYGAGQGVDIYVLDSGVRISHALFGGRASHFNDRDTPYTASIKTVDDEEGHGTHVAGIAAGHRSGVAQWANIINVKVACNDPKYCKGETQGVVNAFRDIIKKHNEKKANPPKGWKGSVINCSFGLTAKNNALNRAIDAAYDAGIPIAVAAGNKQDGTTVDAEGTLCGSHNTICVGGLEKNYNKGYVC